MTVPRLTEGLLTVPCCWATVHGPPEDCTCQAPRYCPHCGSPIGQVTKGELPADRERPYTRDDAAT